MASFPIALGQVWTYDGRHVSTPRFQNLRTAYLSDRAISLSEDAVAILDRTSPKSIRVCDVNTGRPLADGMSAEIEHDCEVVSVRFFPCEANFIFRDVLRYERGEHGTKYDATHVVRSCILVRFLRSAV